MRPINIGIRHDDNAVVTQAVNVEFFLDAGAKRGDQ